MRRHIAAAVVVGVLVSAWSYARQVLHPGDIVDVAPILASARALASGLDPYAAVGPDAAFPWPWPQYYPATTFVALLPLAFLPEELGAALFIGLSAGWLTLVVARSGVARLPMLTSGAFLWAITWRQWSVALVAAALTPALAGLLAVKPTTGLALLAGAGSRRTLVGAAIGGAVLAAIAFALEPGWVGAWLGSFAGDVHFVSPVTSLPLGPLLLLAALRWRRPEARLLLALACMPQTNAVSDVLPLFLVADTFAQATLLAMTTHVVGFVQHAAQGRIDGLASFASYAADSASWLVLGAYLPCLVMVLRRPNLPGAAEAVPRPGLV